MKWDQGVPAQDDKLSVAVKGQKFKENVHNDPPIQMHTNNFPYVQDWGIFVSFGFVIHIKYSINNKEC